MMLKRFFRTIKGIKPTFHISPLFYFFLINLFFLELKTVIEYFVSFNLDIKTPYQVLIAILNPLPTAILLFSIGLYFRGYLRYWIIIFFNFFQSLWLFSNILYYREFNDFITLSVISSGTSVGENLGKSILNIIHPSDFLVFLDILVLAFLIIFKQIRSTHKGMKGYAIFASIFGVISIFLVYGLASASRSGLLTRTFDNNYTVKYLGLNEYAAINFFQNNKERENRENANKKELKPIAKWIKKNHTSDNPKYFGIDKGKNVFVFHLESFQQFLIGLKVNGQEVTPNLNKFYHDEHTMSFDNFYHQVGQGKTSDAETMLDNSLFGLPSGSAMVKYGRSNTFNSIPGILSRRGYSTAAFHGDVSTFWNRNNTYKSWGYQYFFSKNFYKNSNKSNLNLGYGMLDKIFLKDTSKYISQLPQPFYAKIITLTNHYPYEVNKEISRQFPSTKTGDKTVDHYVQTAHYLDSAFGEFINWLKKTGLYNNSLIYAYGDHYGISQNHKPAIAQLLDKKNGKVNNFDLAQFQKVPLMIHANNLPGGINHTYGGEIDVAPTLLDLLGIPSNNFLEFGNDLLSSQRKQVVSFINGDFVTPRYIKMNSSYWETNTGKRVNYNKLPRADKEYINNSQKYVNKQLTYSDKIINGDLLRFYRNPDFKNVNKKSFNYAYKNTINKLASLRKIEPSSLDAKNKGRSFVKDYQTSEIMIKHHKQIVKDLKLLKQQKQKEKNENRSSQSIEESLPTKP